MTAGTTGAARIVPPHAPADGRPLWRWRDGGWHQGSVPASPEEAAVAIVIDGASQAVLMATPHELDDFAFGFALTEGLIASPADVTGCEIVAVPAGPLNLPAHEARLWLRPGLSAGLAERRRSMVGPVGCGLCGVDSIAAALPAVWRSESTLRLSPGDILAAMAALSAGQRRWRDTPAIHAAALWVPRDTPGRDALVREDVGRHNALDKLAGAAARAGLDARRACVAMTSRLSVDLVQKTARMGAPVLMGAGVPTRLAIAWAEAAGVTLIGRARGDSFDVFTHPHRIQD
ncbi:formate dehydrogenase accessory sulfurtransferase FdhD [Paracoccus endophyticus]|uniref:formate dehydrogenase accessory sulfurtransferase FdhD n=1 Tax=Paracoccus endophyticus TaxID=2233774 RepID=UPI000DD4FB57|nr:formate dehydrogenase accessory sulfurtransferase FdhD [Paracoccus endophyticus]